ncbi:transcriptional regulator [Halobacteriales archaeon SW_8_65_20]|nr:MAG: transcriptional regulator [Halobacteriales archaeon SW_8_65_20]
MVEPEPGTEAWKEQTSPFDRVRAVSQSLSIPRSASWIAAEAAVSESAAREHLERLTEMSVLQERDDAGTVKYGPDPIFVRFQTIRELLDKHDLEDLLSLREELRSQSETWRNKYGVKSPEELSRLAAEPDSTERATNVRHTVAEWEVIKYRLDVVEDLIDKYDTYSAHRSTV